MFRKKKEESSALSYEDLQLSSLGQELRDHRDTMISLCRRIMEHEGCANMLPDGVDKNIELKEAEALRKRVLNVVAAYDVARKAYNQIDASKLVHYNGKAEWCDSHDMLRIAWKTAFRKVAGT